MTEGRPCEGQAVAQDVTLDFRAANMAALTLLGPALAFVLIPFGLRWGFRPLQLHAWDWLVIALAFVAGLFAHEALHAFGYAVVGRAGWANVAFGIKALSPYAHCRAPLTARHYRIAGALPGLVLGLAPAGLALAAGSGLVLVYALLMVGGALGDLVMLWAIRAVPGEALVRDHPSRVGCIVLPRPPTD